MMKLFLVQVSLSVIFYCSTAFGYVMATKNQPGAVSLNQPFFDESSGSKNAPKKILQVNALDADAAKRELVIMPTIPQFRVFISGALLPEGFYLPGPKAMLQRTNGQDLKIEVIELNPKAELVDVNGHRVPAFLESEMELDLLSVLKDKGLVEETRVDGKTYEVIR